MTQRSNKKDRKIKKLKRQMLYYKERAAYYQHNYEFQVEYRLDNGGYFPGIEGVVRSIIQDAEKRFQRVWQGTTRKPRVKWEP